MKKTLFGLLLSFLFLGFGTFAAYQQQGFAQFQELDGNMDFACTGQCFALIGSPAGADYISLNGTMQGNGSVWYGFVAWQQIVPGETFPIDWSTAIDKQFSFSALPFYSQIPKTAQVVFIVQWMIAWNQVYAGLGFMNSYQKIWQWWKDFWKMETLTPYSINLRYGVKILWVSLLKYGYWLFFFAALYILLFVKWDSKIKFRKICFRGLGIFLFIGIRNLITYTWIVDQWIQTYVTPSMDKKTFFDLWDYIPFTDKIRKALYLDSEKKSCKIYVDSFQDRPFRAHRQNLYLKPCSLVLTWSEADYAIFYKKPLSSGDLQKTVLVEYNWSYLLKNK